METAQRFSMCSAPATEQAQLDEAGFVCAEHRHDDGSQMATLRSWAPGGAKSCFVALRFASFGDRAL
jgi:hypothetical protein